MRIRRSGWIAVLLAAAIVCAVILPATLAYISASSITYVNTFVPDPRALSDLSVMVNVDKTVTNQGKEAIGPENFIFELTDLDTLKSWTVKTDGQGQAAFLLSYTMQDIGSHRYQLKEVDEKKPGITYSPLVYEIQVDVVEEADAIILRTWLNGQETEEIRAAYENIYDSGHLPETGDSTNYTLYLALLAVSCICLVVLLGHKKKKITG